MFADINDGIGNVMPDVDPDLNYFDGDNDGNQLDVFSLYEFNNKIISTSTPDTFLLTSLNVRSFFKHRDDITSVISAMARQPDVLVLTETWLNVDDEDYATLEGYASFHTVRTGARSGGVSVYYKERYRAESITNLSICNLNIESCCVCIYIGSVKLNIVGIYRPHSGTVEHFITELIAICESSYIGIADRLCILGDFNVNLLDNDSDSVLALVNFM